MSREEVLASLESAGWRRQHWYLFTAISLNYLLDGIVFAIAPLTAVIIAPELATIIFASNLLAETAGSVFFGYLADRRGRKFCLFLMNSIQALSTGLLFFLYKSPLAVLVLTSLMSFSVGGDFGASYAALAEVVPARYRGKAILLSTNFWNIGSAAIAGAALVFRALESDPDIQIQYLLLATIATLGLVAVIRLMVPESPRWLLHVGRTSEAVKISTEIGAQKSQPTTSHATALAEKSGGAGIGFLYRFAILSVITVSQYVTYGMMAYYAPYARGFSFGVESAPLVIFVANIGASIGAPLLWPLIDRSRRLSVLLSFLFGTVFAALVLLTHDSGQPLYFYTTLLLCLVFSEWAWGSVSALQSELFPTGIRATAVGVLTSLTGVSGALMVLTQSIFTASEFLAASVVLWGAGLASTLAWMARGLETANRTVEELSES